MKAKWVYSGEFSDSKLEAMPTQVDSPAFVAQPAFSIACMWQISNLHT